MNLNKLRYVVAVAEEQSITKAAKNLYISQPSLSQCIRALEEQLGTELFVRGKTNLTPTAAGEAFIEWAKLTLESEKQLAQKISEIKTGQSRQLDIGLSWQRGAAFLPGTIELFYASVTGCNIKVHEEINSKLIDSLARDELDLIIGVPHPDVTHYVSAPLFQERFLLASNSELDIPSSPGTPFPSVDPSVIVDHPVVVLRDDMYLGRVFRDLLVKLNYSPSKVTECVNLETAHSLVSKNIGVALLPEVSVFCRILPNVNYYLLNDGDLGRTVAAVYKKNQPRVRDIEKFVYCLKTHISNCSYPFLMSQ